MIISATRPSAKALANNLREISIFEVDKIRGDREGTIRSALDRSAHVWHGTIGRDLVFACGVEASSIITDSAYLWILTTKLVDQHVFTFVRASKLFIQELSVLYPHIYGYVHQDYRKSLPWLRWLGFTLEEPIDGLRHFYMDRR